MWPFQSQMHLWREVKAICYTSVNVLIFDPELWWEGAGERMRERERESTILWKCLRQIKPTKTSTPRFSESSSQNTGKHIWCPSGDTSRCTCTTISHTHSLLKQSACRKACSALILTHPMASPRHRQNSGPSGVLPQPYKPHQNGPLAKGLKSDAKIKIRSHWKWSSFLGCYQQWLREAFTLFNTNKASSSLLIPKALVAHILV